MTFNLPPDSEYAAHGCIERIASDGTTVLRAYVTSGQRPVLSMGQYGPRGGWRPKGIGGITGQLRHQRLLLGELIAYGEEIDAAWREWMEDKDVTPAMSGT